MGQVHKPIALDAPTRATRMTTEDYGMNITQPFFVDPAQPGFVRGGFYDEMGGMLVGVNAEWVCEQLNKALEALE